MVDTPKDMIFYDPTWDEHWLPSRLPSWNQKNDFSCNGMECEDWFIPKLFHTLMKGPDKWAVIHPVSSEVYEPVMVSWFDTKQEAQAFCDKRDREWTEWADTRREEEDG
jgi:hypothetical protein